MICKELASERQQAACMACLQTDVRNCWMRLE